jgi:DNA-binding protein H-NS
MAKLNVDKLSFKELAEFTKAAENRMAELRNQSIDELREKIANMVKEEGFTIDEVIVEKKFKKFIKKAKNTLPPKYQNPDDENQTYKGRGPQPQWLKDKIDAGGKLEDFLIDKS